MDIFDFDNSLVEDSSLLDDKTSVDIYDTSLSHDDFLEIHANIHPTEEIAVKIPNMVGEDYPDGIDGFAFKSNSGSIVNDASVFDKYLSEVNSSKQLPDDITVGLGESNSHNISFGQHVESRSWNMDQAKWYEDIEKREQHEAEKAADKGDVTSARNHTHSAESARMKKEEYLDAAKHCKK